MRYREIKIETQRETPSNSKTVGFGFLVRAGYKTREGEVTALGQRVIKRLQDCTETPGDVFIKSELPIIKSEEGQSFFAIPTGSLEILLCNSCNYAANIETARTRIQPAPHESLLPIEKVQTPGSNTIDSLSQFLGIAKEKTAKALMYSCLADGKFIFVLLRGDKQLSETKLTKLVGEVRAASSEEITKAGAVPGYASPVGLTDALVIVDELIPQSQNLTIGANEYGYHLMNANYDRDYKANIIADLVRAQVGDPCPNCGKPLANMAVEILADSIGYEWGNILYALAEVHHDEKGLTMPASVAPFDLELLQLSGKLLDTRAKAEELNLELTNAGISVLFDDRDERAGVKFNDADLIGCPIRVTVGEKYLKDGMVELKFRKSQETILVNLPDTVNAIKSDLRMLQQ